MNVTDISVAVILLLGLVGGLRRGLSGELLRIITIIVAIVVGWKGADAGAAWIATQIDSTVDDVKPAAFFGLIAATYIILAITRLIFRLLIDFSFKGKLELFGGGLLGLLRTAAYCAIILLGISLFDYPPVNEAVDRSRSGQLVNDFVRPIYDDIAARRPDLKLPEAEQRDRPASSRGLDTPAYEKYLGPLIDQDDDGD